MTTVLRQIGVVTRPHGLRGEIKVRPDTDDPTRFESLEAVYVGREEADARTWKIVGVRYQAMRSGTAVVLALDGLSDREGAERLSGMSVWADEDALPPLDEGEVYVSDLVGLEVRDASGSVLGSIADVLDLPAQPVLVVIRPSGAQALVPFVAAFIERVDSDAVVVRPIDGLLDPESQDSVD